MLYSSATPDFKEVVERTTSKADAASVPLEVYDTANLNDKDEVRFLTDIHSIRPQTHGQIRSGKGRTLPISRTGQLNISIPIIVFYDDAKAVDVFPKDMYVFDMAFKVPIGVAPISVEENIVSILLAKPDLLGDGLMLIDSEFATSFGVVDLLFKSKEGVLLAVEVKETANQETVGQVQKQAAGLKEKFGSQPIRSAIVALSKSGNVVAACKTAGIKLYLLSTVLQS